MWRVGGKLGAEVNTRGRETEVKWNGSKQKNAAEVHPSEVHSLGPRTAPGTLYEVLHTPFTAAILGVGHSMRSYTPILLPPFWVQTTAVYYSWGVSHWTRALRRKVSFGWRPLFNSTNLGRCGSIRLLFQTHFLSFMTVLYLFRSDPLFRLYCPFYPFHLPIGIYMFSPFKPNRFLHFRLKKQIVS